MIDNKLLSIFITLNKFTKMCKNTNSMNDFNRVIVA